MFKIVLFQFSGTPFFPDNDRFWAIIEKYRATIFYTAPTAIRSLMKFGVDYVERYPVVICFWILYKSYANIRHDLSSLRILGSVGEPINRDAWLWFRSVVGNNICSIVDTYWQTETGGHIITPLPGCTPMKPGSAVNITNIKDIMFVIEMFILISVVPVLRSWACFTRW
jgi:acetyl-CoA synthetase